jgi:hypothetical protein
MLRSKFATVSPDSVRAAMNKQTNKTNIQKQQAFDHKNYSITKFNVVSKNRTVSMNRTKDCPKEISLSFTRFMNEKMSSAYPQIPILAMDLSNANYEIQWDTHKRGNQTFWCTPYSVWSLRVIVHSNSFRCPEQGGGGALPISWYTQTCRWNGYFFHQSNISMGCNFHHCVISMGK